MKIVFLFSILFFVLPIQVFAAPAELEDVARALEKPFSESAPAETRIKDFQAQFFQQSHIASIDRVQRGEGIVSFKFLPGTGEDSATALFRWEYRKPQIQEILSDGRFMWVYIPDNRQVIESEIAQVNQQQGQNPVTFLSGLGDLSRDFEISWAAPRLDEEGHYRLRLTPRSPSQLIKEMVVVVAEEAVEVSDRGGDEIIFPIIQTEVTDPHGNVTIIAFEEVRVNLNLPDRMFRFETPEEVETVRPAEQFNN